MNLHQYKRMYLLQYIAELLQHMRARCPGTAPPSQHTHRPGTAAPPYARRRSGGQRRAEGRSERRCQTAGDAGAG
jgi:hypothetical protein